MIVSERMYKGPRSLTEVVRPVEGDIRRGLSVSPEPDRVPFGTPDMWDVDVQLLYTNFLDR